MDELDKDDLNEEEHSMQYNSTIGSALEEKNIEPELDVKFETYQV